MGKQQYPKGDQHDENRLQVYQIKKEIAGIKTQNRKPSFSCIGFQSSVNDPRNKVFLIDHEPYGPRTTHDVDCDQEPVGPRSLILIGASPVPVLLHTPPSQKHSFFTMLSTISSNLAETQMKPNPKDCGFGGENKSGNEFKGQGRGSDSTKQF
ncbi:hypothetical protein SESBI_40266 [Sesbania bispinosa]|nr:hypothetical protein SESBI_40266 [Sesbania bispinosa]